VASFYLGVSCLYTYSIACLSEGLAFHNVEQLRKAETGAAPLEAISRNTWYGSQILLTDFHITLSSMEACYAVLLFAAVILMSAIIGTSAYYFWHTHPRLLTIPASMFILTVGIASYFTPAKLGTVLAAACYSLLFFVARGARDFNIHWDLASDTEGIDEVKLAAILKLLNQYMLTAIAAVAFIIAACFFNASTLIKDALWTQGAADANRLYRAIQLPFLISTMSYGMWGCVWMSALIIRELHIKQHESLLMRLGSRGRK
jgi:hypothetical protein